MAIDTFKAAGEMSVSDTSDAEYMHVIVKAPRLTGFALKCFVWLLETRFTAKLLTPKLKKDNLITKFFMESRFHEPPMYLPEYPEEAATDEKEMRHAGLLQIDKCLSAPERVGLAVACLPNPSRGDSSKGFRHWTVRDYAAAYRSGKCTPTLVLERFLSAVEDSEKRAPGMSLFINCNEADIRRQAADSTARYQKGIPLSVLDGVPIAVKDEIDCLPYPTTGGTKWLHKVREVTKDAACVKRIRDCGAVLVGKTTMHELGMGTTCINPHYGATRNPYDKDKVSGGSSGGSAAVVAAGLCPAALGVDGGGSVRMPAALCGVFGLKPTFGRTSSAGVLPIAWTVGMVGVLAATLEDTLIMYAAIYGHLPQDSIASIPPPATFPWLHNVSEISIMVGRLKYAKYTKWFDDADDAVKAACNNALSLLHQTHGCKGLEVTVPEIEEMRLAHFITIGSECCQSFGIDYEKEGMESSGGDVRVGYAIYKSFSNREFIAAQRMRYRQMHFFMEIFKEADFMVTPTTGCVAPPVRLDSLTCGELNYSIGAKLMRFQIAGNFLGLPAITVPVGHDVQGLPIGLQLIGRPWSEGTLLQVASCIEELCGPMKQRPEVLYDLLL